MKPTMSVPTRWLALGLGAVVALGASAPVVAQDDERPRRDRDRQADGERGERGERGEERGERRRGGENRGLRALLRGIELDADQKELMKDIAEEISAEMEAYREATRDIREEMRDAREAGDREAMETLMAELREIPRPDLEAHADDIRDILTGDQRETFDENLEELRERLQERRERMEERREGRGGEDGERRRRGGGDRERGDDDD